MCDKNFPRVLLLLTLLYIAPSSCSSDQVKEVFKESVQNFEEHSDGFDDVLGEEDLDDDEMFEYFYNLEILDKVEKLSNISTINNTTFIKVLEDSDYLDEVLEDSEYLEEEAEDEELDEILDELLQEEDLIEEVGITAI